MAAAAFAASPGGLFLAPPFLRGSSPATRGHGATPRRPRAWALPRRARGAASMTTEPPSAGEAGMSQSEKMAALLGRDVKEDAQRQREESEKLRAEAAAQKTKERRFAALGVFVGLFFAIIEAANPDAPVQLLRKSEEDSTSISAIGNGKPTLVDFHADWCTNCKAMAVDMYRLEHSSRFRESVNFVSLNADDSNNAAAVDRFQVDGIPHHVIIDKNGEVKATLVGLVPINVFEEDLRALLDGKSEVPYIGAAYNDIESFGTD